MSILDIVRCQERQNQRLRRYRSRHESLICFSNTRYYESKLITFPPLQTKPSTVIWRRLVGVYAKGRASQRRSRR